MNPVWPIGRSVDHRVRRERRRRRRLAAVLAAELRVLAGDAERERAEDAQPARTRA